MNYPSIRIEGAIFSPDILDRLEDAPGLGNKISTSSTRRPPRAEIFSHPWTAKKALQKRGLQQNIYEGPDEGQRAGQKNKPLEIKGLFMQMAEKVGLGSVPPGAETRPGACAAVEGDEQVAPPRLTHRLREGNRSAGTPRPATLPPWPGFPRTVGRYSAVSAGPWSFHRWRPA